MCGPTSAIGLESQERALWLAVKDQLRRPGVMPGLMRGFLADSEVAAVVEIEPTGAVRPVAVLVTLAIAEELALSDPTLSAHRQAARIGEYDVEVLVGEVDGQRRPAAVLVTQWIYEHLILYSRQLWRPRRE